ncbi:hypothetical protein GOBAR_AA36123 [Gossypium barbadense]|uniref:Uncharacterized protein n=1 Tax=Gossypium barbadense TaxID=3634 RepID=A0A2P5W0J6_GOSBA|nr:hypothetical protein GOBAR_AA36123 [Gossypium barbadense]
MSNSRQVLAEQWGGPKEFETNWSFDGQKSKRIEIDGRGGGDGDSTDRIMSCRTAWGSIIGSPPLIFRHLMSVSDSWSLHGTRPSRNPGLPLQEEMLSYNLVLDKMNSVLGL